MKKNIIIPFVSVICVALIVSAFFFGRYVGRNEVITIDESVVSDETEESVETTWRNIDEYSEITLKYNTNNGYDYEYGFNIRTFGNDTCIYLYIDNYEEFHGREVRLDISKFYDIAEIINSSEFEEYTFETRFDSEGRVIEHENVERLLIVDGVFIVNDELIDQVEAIFNDYIRLLPESAS